MDVLIIRIVKERQIPRSLERCNDLVFNSLLNHTELFTARLVRSDTSGIIVCSVNRNLRPVFKSDMNVVYTGRYVFNLGNERGRPRHQFILDLFRYNQFRLSLCRRAYNEFSAGV